MVVAFCSGCRFWEFVLGCACMSGVFRLTGLVGGVFGVVGYWFLPLFSPVFSGVLNREVLSPCVHIRDV